MYYQEVSTQLILVYTKKDFIVERKLFLLMLNHASDTYMNLPPAPVVIFYTNESVLKLENWKCNILSAFIFV